MITDAIKKRITQAMKERDEVAKGVLRLALSEINAAEARANRPLREDEEMAIVRKLVKSNEETLGATADRAQQVTLLRENELLAAFLPPSMSVAQIVEALASQREAIAAAKSDGQATGIAMKHMKSTGAVFDGNDVAMAAKQLRG
jgi:uncharacterized protein YqeY